MFNTGYIIFDIFLYFILINKICLILLNLSKINTFDNKFIDNDQFVIYYKFLHDLFNLNIGILLIILFNPISEKYMILTHHIKLFLFVFGILTIINLISKTQLSKNLKSKI